MSPLYTSRGGHDSNRCLFVINFGVKSIWSRLAEKADAESE